MLSSFHAPLELVDTLGGWLSEDNTLRDSALAATAAYAATVDDISLLGLVAEAARLIWASRAGGAVDSGELTVLPAADAQQKLEHIRLLLLPQLLEILVGT